MNANELAEIIEHLENARYIGASKAASMLRQQQAEIERLTMLCDCMTTESNRKGNEIEALKKEAALQRLSDFTQEAESFDRTASHMAGEYVFYPVKEQLTDEEINVVAILQDAEIVPVGHEIWKTGEEFNKYKRIVLATAKALRKAQE